MASQGYGVEAPHCELDDHVVQHVIGDDGEAEDAEQENSIRSREDVESTDGVSHFAKDSDLLSPAFHDIGRQTPVIRPSESPLFEPEDPDITISNMSLGVAPEPGSSSPFSAVNSTLDGLRRARAIKFEVSKSLTILQPKTMRPRNRQVEEDPENQAIKKMRQDDGMGWDAIASYLNEERLKRGEPAILTTAAVYSRFVRNAPRIAAAHGEIGFDPKDSNIAGAVNNPSGYSYGAGGGRKRVRNDEKAAEDLANNLRQKCNPTLSEQAKMLEKVDVTEQLMAAVASVEKDFWGHVANALEKETGKWFDARALESRFHSI
ncbi:hypothetical protein N0V90_011453 [Kalmusia sp. IMI 367209]|nr:hypothetical protein N0V90_011453 [Kalmusia sp. IMI 367209]